MNLESLILTVLKARGTVSVPNLGTFSMQYKPARLVKAEQVRFYPPQMEVKFSSKTNDSDQTLAYLLAKVSKNTPQNAYSAILVYVQLVHARLAEGKPVKFNGLGTLQTNGKFTSANIPICSAEYFGLADFSMPKVGDVRRKHKLSHTEIIAKNVAKGAFITSPIVFGALLIPNILQISHDADLASLLRETKIILDSTKPDVPRPQNFTPTLRPVQLDTAGENLLAYEDEQSLRKRKEYEDKLKSSQSSTIESQTVKETLQTAKIQHKFYVIVGSFPSKVNAEELLRSLKNRNYDAGILNKDNKIRVYITSFDDRKDARLFTERLRNEAEFSEAWVLAN